MWRKSNGESSTINFDYFSLNSSFSYQLQMYINKYSQQFDYMLIGLKGFFRSLQKVARPVLRGSFKCHFFFVRLRSFLSLVCFIQNKKSFLVLKYTKFFNGKQLRILKFLLCSFSSVSSLIVASELSREAVAVVNRDDFVSLFPPSIKTSPDWCICNIKLWLAEVLSADGKVKENQAPLRNQPLMFNCLPIIKSGNERIDEWKFPTLALTRNPFASPSFQKCIRSESEERIFSHVNHLIIIYAKA